MVYGEFVHPGGQIQNSQKSEFLCHTLPPYVTATRGGTVLQGKEFGRSLRRPPGTPRNLHAESLGILRARAAGL